MKTNRFIVPLLFLLIPATNTMPVSHKANGSFYVTGSGMPGYQVLDDWKVRKARKGIQISVRWILTSRNAKTRQLLGSLVLPVSREQVIRLFRQETSARQWMGFMDELKYYRVNDSPDEWFSYGRINIMGKVASFDVVTSNRLINGITPYQSLIVMNDAPGFLPGESGVHRITGLSTTWTLTSLEKGRTSVELMMYSDMKPVIPVWVTDPVVTSTLYAMLDRFREKAMEDIAAEIRE